MTFGQGTMEVKPPRVVKRVEAGWDPLMTIQVPGLGEAYIGKDLRLYRKTNGLLSIITEAATEEEVQLWIADVKYDEFPNMRYVHHLFDTYFTQYNREVMLIVGKRWDNGDWLFMVPKQIGTLASIDWKDEEGMAWFAKEAEFIGTIHVHPGGGAEPSGVDLGWWAKKDASGLHMILGREGAWTLSGSCAGKVINLTKGEGFGDEPAIPAPIVWSLGRTPEELLIKPPPIKISKKQQKKWNRYRNAYKGNASNKSLIIRPKEYHETVDSIGGSLWSEMTLQELTVSTHGGLVLNEAQFNGLRVLDLGDGQLGIVTFDQWLDIQIDLGRSNETIPAVKSLRRRVYDGEGGKS